MTYGEENRAFAQKIGVPEEVFASATVVLELPASHAHRHDARAAFLLAANLLVRLFHRVHLLAPDVPFGPNPWHLKTLHDARPILESLSEGSVAWTSPDSADVSIGIGSAPCTGARQTVVVGFRRSVVWLDRSSAEGEEDVLAGLIAACYAASQTFLHIAAGRGASLAPIQPFEFFLPTRGHDDAVDIGTVHLAGVGAIGCALVYGLAHLPCKGAIVATDDDPVDTTNLHRYVLMRRDDVGKQKVVVAASALEGNAVTVEPHVSSYQTYLKSATTRNIQLLVSAVDSEAGRRHLAASLPRRVVNASTTDRYITVSRHGFGDGRACLYCLYAPAGGPKTTEHRIAEDLGVGMLEVERLIAENAPVDAAFVRRVEQHRNVAEGTYAIWVGKPLQSFHQRAVCGGAAIQMPEGTVVAPLGFISAAAGLLLLADLVGGRSLADEESRANYLRLDMFSSPEFADRDVRTPDPTRRCICGDDDYVYVYRRRYGTGPVSQQL